MPLNWTPLTENDIKVFREKLPPAIVEVPIKPFQGSKKLHCFDNAKLYVQRHGGEVVLGWIFSHLEGLLIRRVGHAAVRLDDSTLLCVTPPEHPSISSHFFYADNSIISEIKNNRLPVKTIAIHKDPSIRAYAEIETLIHRYRIEGNEAAIAMTYYFNRKAFDHLEDDVLRVLNGIHE